MEFEERNAALQKHVESMRTAVEKLEVDVIDLPSFPLSQYMNQNESVSVEGEGEERRVEQKKKICFQKRCCFLRGQT